jgi:hypothetical protein
MYKILFKTLIGRFVTNFTPVKKKSGAKAVNG